MISLEKIYSQTCFGTYQTNYNTGNADRTTNLRLATNKINGYILRPGQEFSYNRVVGKRTIDAGYRAAPIYSGGKVVDDIGGGICQVSSTLYNAALLSDLQITSRSNHSFITSYADPGRDATVFYGAIDFKFKNTTKYPIKIVASTQNGIEKISIYGINVDKVITKVYTQRTSSKEPETKYEDNPELKAGKTKVVQGGSRGYTVNTYKETYVDGVLKEKKIISVDTYKPLTRIIQRGTKK